MADKHTPGPWHWGDGWEEAIDDDGALIIGEDAEEETGNEPIKYADLQLFGANNVEVIPIRIDHFGVIFDGDRIAPADRKLIAAAPDLLAELVKIADAMSHFPEMALSVQAIRAVVAKAT